MRISLRIAPLLLAALGVHLILPADASAQSGRIIVAPGRPYQPPSNRSYYLYPPLYQAPLPTPPRIGYVPGNNVPTFSSGFPFYSFYSAVPSVEPEGRAMMAPPIPPPINMTSEPPSGAAQVAVRVPTADAEVWFDSTRTSQTGMDRLFKTPDIAPDGSFTYRIRARWVANGQYVEQTRIVNLSAGQQVTLDFTQ
jgi:uncharacterized protein (TIGR03000 family)